MFTDHCGPRITKPILASYRDCCLKGHQPKSVPSGLAPIFFFFRVGGRVGGVVLRYTDVHMSEHRFKKYPVNNFSFLHENHHQTRISRCLSSNLKNIPFFLTINIFRPFNVKHMLCDVLQNRLLFTCVLSMYANSHISECLPRLCDIYMQGHVKHQSLLTACTLKRSWELLAGCCGFAGAGWFAAGANGSPAVKGLSPPAESFLAGRASNAKSKSDIVLIPCKRRKQIK